MSILATALFGSRARGDGSDRSDIDILVWEAGGHPRQIRDGIVSYAFYPEDDLLAMARRGDLFAAHLALEARELHDPGGRLEALRRTYRPPADYGPQISAASDLAWFLVDAGEVLAPSIFNARAAWCGRTMAMAKAAQGGIPVFATERLATELREPLLPRIVGDKDRPDRDADAAERLAELASRLGAARPLQGEAATAAGYADHFGRTGNGFALKTMRRAGLKDSDGRYL